eukprot:CCRYP_003467-RA/>CCRYP_003467-RA protein AED:0.32 eAED:0.32 QI:0/-1/0/1/-1/1/1/0/296
MKLQNKRHMALAVITAAFSISSLFLSSDALLVRQDPAHIYSSSLHRIGSSWSLPSQPNGFVPSSIVPASNKSKSRLIRFYVEEWADADVELAFNPTKSNVSPVIQCGSPLFKRLLLQFTKLLLQMKEIIRTRIERCTVYVLELENGKYYVGSTTNRKRRIQEHINRRGSKWTREHKPIRVLREYRRIPSKYILGMESRITAELMLEFGVNNVRGSMFCGTREFNMGDIDALTKFIGHYNDLNYRKVHVRLSQTLPAVPNKTKKSNNGTCFCCGKYGHFAANCPDREGSKQDHRVFQ